MRRLLLVAALLIAGCAAPPALPPGGTAFALLGDIPYSQPHANLLDAMIDRMNAEPLAFVAHVGDITSGQGPCGDDWLEARQRQFARISHPFILLPGDNEWTDCHRSGFEPLERLAKWRALFCADDARLRIERQSRLDARFPEYCEHLRWEAVGTLFVALNVPGSNNNLGRTPAMDAEHARRMAAVLDWLDAGYALAEARRLKTVVVLMHADPDFEHRRRRGAGVPDGYARLRDALAGHARRFGGRSLLVHGDSHTYLDDLPLPGLRRVEVYGWPHARWLRGAIPPGAAAELMVAPASP